MLTWAVDKLLKTGMGAAWKPVRSFYEGVSGTSKYTMKNGDKVKLNPAQKLARRLKNDGRQILTGKKYNMKGEDITEEGMNAFNRHVTSRLGGALHLIGDATIGTAFTGAGWLTRGMGMGLFMGGAMAAKPTIKGLGHVTKQSIDLVGDTAIEGASKIHRMNQTAGGREALMWMGGLGAAGTGIMAGANDTWGASGIKIAMRNQYDGEMLDAVPGTIAETNVMRRDPLDDMGADGDLVFAMHNMR